MNRSGIVLPSVLMVLLLLELLAVATLALALQHAAAARDTENAIRAQQIARVRVSTVLSDWKTNAFQRIEIGQQRTFTTPDGQTTVARLSSEMFLLSALALDGPPQQQSRANAALLFALPDAAAIAEAFPAAIAANSEVTLMGDSEVDGEHADQPPNAWSSQVCSNWIPAAGAKPAAIMSAGALQAGPRATIAGAVTAALTPVGVAPQFSQSVVTEIADRIESGAVEPLPMAANGECLTSVPGNWGAPLDPGHPCSDYFPLIHAPGDLSVVSGSGQGILVVEGNLNLGPGVEFFGPVIVRGQLNAAPGSAITGALIVDGPSLLQSASIRSCHCAVERALLSASALNRPILRRGRSWLPSF